MASEPLAIVEEWKRKSREFSDESEDSFSCVFTRCHETVSLILKDSDRRRITNAMAVLDLERSASLSLENDKEPSIRSMMYGTIESFQLAIEHLMEKVNKLSKDDWTQTEEIPSVDSIGNDIVFKDDEIVAEEQVATADSPLDSDQPDNISTAPTFCHSFPIYKRELIDPSDKQNIPADTQIPSKDAANDKVVIKKEEITKEEILDDYMGPLMNVMGDDAPLREEVKEETEDRAPVEDVLNADFMGNDAPLREEVKEEATFPEDLTSVMGEQGSIDGTTDDDDNMDGTIQSEMFDNNGDSMDIDTIEKKGRKKKSAGSADDESSSATKKAENGERSSRRVSKPLKYVESEEDSDEHEEPSQKNSSGGRNQRKRKAANDSVEKKPKIYKRSDTEMECMECDYRSHSINAFNSHLRGKHSTNLALSGLVLRCECGHECLSRTHSMQCEKANFTVVRKRIGPIRRLGDEKETPQCLLCEMHPKTMRGFAYHLQIHHRSTLVMNGIKLKCESCGVMLRRGNEDIEHTSDECDGRQYSLHKITDE